MTGFQTGRSKCNEKIPTDRPAHLCCETYNHNGDLYRVESFDEGYTEPKVTLRRIKDGTIFDVEAPALFLTPTGVQLLWPREVNQFCSTLEQAV